MATILDDEFWRALAPRLDDLRMAKENAILEGQPDDYAEYRDGVGYLRAMRDVKDAVQGLFNDLSGRKPPNDDADAPQEG